MEVLSLAMVLRENIAGLPPGSEHTGVEKVISGSVALQHRFTAELTSAHWSAHGKPRTLRCQGTPALAVPELPGPFLSLYF